MAGLSPAGWAGSGKVFYMGEFQAVLFDFDGVIGRTLEDNYQAWVHVFAEFGAVIDAEEYFLMEGRRSTHTVRHFLAKNGLDPELAPEVIARKNEYYARHNTFQLYEGVGDLLRALRAAELKLGVVSGGSAARLHSPPSCEVLPLFDVVVTGDDCPAGKPAPDPYLMAAAKLAVEPEACLVIENAPLGIEAAKSAGMECIALCSTLARAHLQRADRVLDNLRDLKVLLVGGGNGRGEATD
jgi:beta-phosphoglucomutase